MTEATKITSADYEQHHDKPPDRKRLRELFLACDGSPANIRAWNAMCAALRTTDCEWEPDLSSAEDVLETHGVYWFGEEDGLNFGIDLMGAKLNHAILLGAELNHADLTGVELRHANLVGAKLNHATLYCAVLDYANLSRAKLNHGELLLAQLEGCTWDDCDLTDADVTDVQYDRSKLDGKCRGVRARTCYGHALFKRDMQDQDLIDTLGDELRQRRNTLDYDARTSPRNLDPVHRWNQLKNQLALQLFNAWGWIDYGRSMMRTAAIAFALAMLFGLVFLVAAKLGHPMLQYGEGTPDWWFTPFYYSIVTYTTLGFGDVTPCTKLGQIIVVIEVIFGYMTLGLLVSILANKVARRS